ncbi:MAG: flagellar hook capping protein [Lachnospiraceae bacterium]|nr:flagellar hook capping protein [Lachnospiraceae bacterium]
MAVTVPVQDGQIVNGYDPNATETEAKRDSNSSLDKEAFLQLLVAQMKYQDPLEPTSNTEYISQLATFSSLEEMQNMRASLETSQATSLVGKTVIMAVTSNGETNYVSGRVDQVRKEGNKTYLSIDDAWYNLDDLDTVVDDEYLDATLIGEDFKEAVGNMPDPDKLTVADKDKLNAIAAAYDSLTSYQKAHIARYCKDELEKFKALITKMNELLGNNSDSSDKVEGDGNTDKPDDTTGGTDNKDENGQTEGNKTA